MFMKCNQNSDLELFFQDCSCIIILLKLANSYKYFPNFFSRLKSHFLLILFVCEFCILIKKVIMIMTVQGKSIQIQNFKNAIGNGIWKNKEIQN